MENCPVCQKIITKEEYKRGSCPKCGESFTTEKPSFTVEYWLGNAQARTEKQVSGEGFGMFLQIIGAIGALVGAVAWGYTEQWIIGVLAIDSAILIISLGLIVTAVARTANTNTQILALMEKSNTGQ